MHENETDTMVPALPAFAADVFRHLAPLDHPFAKELSVSWLALNLRRALERESYAVAAQRARNWSAGSGYCSCRSARGRRLMKIQIFSDLHLDVAAIKPITIMDGIDAVIVAGDTCEGALKAFEHLRRIVPLSIPILMVMGNHEYYRRFLPDELALAREHAPSFNIHLLENDNIVLGSGGVPGGVALDSGSVRAACVSSARRCGPTTRSSARPMSRA